MTSVSGDSKYITSSKQWIPPTKEFIICGSSPMKETHVASSTSLITQACNIYCHRRAYCFHSDCHNKEVADIAQTTAKSGGTIVSNGGDYYSQWHCLESLGRWDDSHDRNHSFNEDNGRLGSWRSMDKHDQSDS